jgi:hypothetical protein
MRLLERKPDGDLVFRESADKDAPTYAILSHTWLANNNEEVSFQDVEASTDKGKSKAGWEKIQFCADKAAADGLRYFWIDTCCIDKKNAVELQEAINSMFRWYQNASKCYVYLSDVSSGKWKAYDQSSEFPWDTTFRLSRWFTRGWTLQELLAPRSVEFFSREHERLGDNRTLERQIHEVTNIAIPALRGNHLSQFSVDERLSWAKNRQTTREEDKAYSMLGIFDIQMPLLYGEGEEKAFKRLRREIGEPSSSPEMIRRVLLKCRVLDRGLSQLLDAGKSSPPDATYHEIRIQCGKAIDRMQKFAEQLGIVDRDTAASTAIHQSARMTLIWKEEEFTSINEDLDDCLVTLQLCLTMVTQR